MSKENGISALEHAQNQVIYKDDHLVIRQDCSNREKGLPPLIFDPSDFKETLARMKSDIQRMNETVAALTDFEVVKASIEEIHDHFSKVEHLIHSLGSVDKRQTTVGREIAASMLHVVTSLNRVNRNLDRIESLKSTPWYSKFLFWKR